MAIRRKKQTVYAFIDSQNLNVGVQKFGWKMDWRKFRKFLADKYGVDKAFMFIGYVPEMESLYEQLHEAGYMIVLKPTFDLTRPHLEVTEGDKKEHEDKKPVKGNIDAELVLWAMKERGDYEKAIIVSGDGDFYSLVEFLEEQGKLLKLLTPSGQYSSLYNRFDSYVEQLDKYRRQLAYYDHKKKHPKSQ
jgi:uncharacterized LabA/DUF88 family protein